MRRGLVVFAGAGLAAGVALAPAVGAGADGPPPASFTQAQVGQGQQLFVDNCSSCHGQNLNDGQFAPSLKGAVFRGKWSDKSVGELYGFVINNMPPGQTGVLAPEDYAAIVSFLMQSNGAAPGKAPLQADANVLATEAWPAPATQQQASK